MKQLFQKKKWVRAPDDTPHPSNDKRLRSDSNVFNKEELLGMHRAMGGMNGKKFGKTIAKDYVKFLKANGIAWAWWGGEEVVAMLDNIYIAFDIDQQNMMELKSALWVASDLELIRNIEKYISQWCTYLNSADNYLKEKDKHPRKTKIGVKQSKANDRDEDEIELLPMEDFDVQVEEVVELPGQKEEKKRKPRKKARKDMTIKEILAATEATEREKQKAFKMTFSPGDEVEGEEAENRLFVKKFLYLNERNFQAVKKHFNQHTRGNHRLQELGWNMKKGSKKRPPSGSLESLLGRAERQVSKKSTKRKGFEGPPIIQKLREDLERFSALFKGPIFFIAPAVYKNQYQDNYDPFVYLTKKWFSKKEAKQMISLALQIVSSRKYQFDERIVARALKMARDELVADLEDKRIPVERVDWEALSLNIGEDRIIFQGTRSMYFPVGWPMDTNPKKMDREQLTTANELLDGVFGYDDKIHESLFAFIRHLRIRLEHDMKSINFQLFFNKNHPRAVKKLKSFRTHFHEVHAEAQKWEESGGHGLIVPRFDLGVDDMQKQRDYMRAQADALDEAIAKSKKRTR